MDLDMAVKYGPAIVSVLMFAANGVFILAIKLNDLRHVESDQALIKADLKEVRKTQTEQGKSIEYIKGQVNILTGNHENKVNGTNS